jgi:hypothetical protein
MRVLPGGVALAAAIAAFAPAAASGQTFRAACTDGVGDTDSLASAIVAANTAPGPDVVALGADCTYLFEKRDNNWYGPNALAPIASDITIEGNGGAIARDPTAAHFRLFFVGADPGSPRTDNYVSPGAGVLTLRDVTLANGYVKGGDSSGGGGGAGMGGAIFNQGTLIIERSTLTRNGAQGGSSGISTAGSGAAAWARTRPSGSTAVASAHPRSRRAGRVASAASSQAEAARASGLGRTATTATWPSSARAVARRQAWAAPAETSGLPTAATAAAAAPAVALGPGAVSARAARSAAAVVSAAVAVSRPPRAVAGALAGAGASPATRTVSRARPDPVASGVAGPRGHPGAHPASAAAHLRTPTAAAAPAWAARSSTCRAA